MIWKRAPRICSPPLSGCTTGQWTQHAKIWVPLLLRTNWSSNYVTLHVTPAATKCFNNYINTPKWRLRSHIWYIWVLIFMLRRTATRLLRYAFAFHGSPLWATISLMATMTSGLNNTRLTSRWARSFFNVWWRHAASCTIFCPIIRRSLPIKGQLGHTLNVSVLLGSQAVIVISTLYILLNIKKT